MKFIFLFFLLFSCSNKDWRKTSRESMGIAPQASELNESIVQIYIARAFSWRGAFAVHPWVAWKKVGEKSYTVAQVIGWKSRQGQAVEVKEDIPDRRWFDSEPEIIFEARADKADKIIARFKELIETYPYKDFYRLYPGPNSNTFVAYLIHNTDEIKISLPPHAIGKDWPVDYQFISTSPSGTGFQASAFGVLGLTLGLEEGIEINILALNFGIDIFPPALKLPLIGRLGFKDKAVTD